MNPRARRKEQGDLFQSEELFLNSKPEFIRPFLKFWMKMWRVIYYLVSLSTYIGLLVGLVITSYFSFISVDVNRAIISGLCTVLIIHVNKVNPN